MMISSLRREMSTPAMAATNANSATRSREAVPSMEFSVTLPKPSSRATATGSSPSVLPASAPEPYGLASMRLSQSTSRCTSRSSGHTCAMS